MKRISVVIYLLILFTMNPLSAVSFENKNDVKSDLRILELLPNLLCPLAVDPAIPEDFVALSPTGRLDLFDWIYWGPKEVLEKYFKDPDSLNMSLIRVKLSGNVAQTGPNSFSDEESTKALKMLQKKDPKACTFLETNWGNYPVHTVRMTMMGKTIFTTWVGLNDQESGWTLMFNLVYPEKKGHPNANDFQLWENLLRKTKPLGERDTFKILGQDLQEGYTLVNIAGAKLKMIAEKREIDGKVQVVVMPENPEVEFNYVDMEECQMGAKWKYGEPMVKVYGEITLKSQNSHSTTRYVTSIFFKTVPEFSFHNEDEKELLIYQKMPDDELKL